MSSIVMELQRDALDRDTSVSDLLRKALVVARKLKVTGFESWVGNELNGYARPINVPPYRVVYGQVKAWNPYHGWIPVVFPPKLAELVTKQHIAQPLPEIERQLEASKGGGILAVPYAPEIESRLMASMNVQLKPMLHVDPGQVSGIPSGVRNAILDWTLKLEEQGILGDGLSFSTKEKAAASALGSTVMNFMGPVGHSNVMNGSPGANQAISITQLDLGQVRQLVQEISDSVEEIEVPPEQRRELVAEAETIKAQTTSPKPKMSIVWESLGSIRRILETAGGRLAAMYLAKLLGLSP